jgi:phosphatidylserine/phosphatidylglycerophosphate/cardiolipin synthase-like enzyme
VKLVVQPEAGLAPVIQAIQGARQSIDIAIFRSNRREIDKALGSAVARGVRVRALVAHTNRGGEAALRRLEQRLLAQGVAVSRTGDELLKYHGKYLIADNVLHLFGFNYTRADITKSRSFGVQTRDRRAVKDALSLFEADLARQPFAIASMSSPLIVSPETSRAALQRFVAGARKQLAIYDARLEDSVFVRQLRQKAESGVTVQVLGRAPKLDLVTQVRPMKELRLHVRAIIRDGTRAFVGSQSLRRLELDRRREVGLIITNPAVVRRMLSVFEADWGAAAPKDEKDSADAATANGKAKGENGKGEDKNNDKLDNKKDRDR